MKNNIINDLEPFMFTSQNLNRFNRYINFISENNNTGKTNKNIIIQKKNNISNVKKKFFSVIENDKLFWYIYIIVNGIDSYYMNKNNIYKEEKNFKFNCIPLLREKKKILKSMKINVNHVENNLINSKQIDMNTTHALCILFNISLIFYKNPVYYEFNYGKTKHLIEKNDKEIIYYLEPKQDKINKIREKNYFIDLLKPIKGISSYKLGELQKMADKLNIDIVSNNKKKTKKIIYQEIIIKIEKLM